MDQVVQLVGAVLILVAFTASQGQRMSPQSWAYVVLNLVGSAVLAVVAAADSDWGFLLLEGVWAVVSLWALVRLARGQTPTAAH